MVTKYVRTEDEQVGKMPIPVKLGDKQFDVAVLSINANMAWRTKFNDQMGSLALGLGTSVGADSLAGGLTAALISFPEKMLDLLLGYSPLLAAEKDWILENATEEQISVAFSRIVSVAYPFLAQLGTVLKAGATLSRQQ